MSLKTAHKILISAAVAVLSYHAFWELSAYRETDRVQAAVRGSLSLLAAVGFAAYLRWFWIRSRAGRGSPRA